MKNDEKTEELEMRTKGSQAAERSAHFLLSGTWFVCFNFSAGTAVYEFPFSKCLYLFLPALFLSLSLTLITLIAFLHKLAYYFRCARRIFFHSSTIITRFFCTCSFRRSHTLRSFLFYFSLALFFWNTRTDALGRCCFCSLARTSTIDCLSLETCTQR